MTQIMTNVEAPPPDIALTRLIDRRGAWATLRALAVVLWRRRPRRPGTQALPDHLRRDIGLPERGAQPQHLRDPWL